MNDYSECDCSPTFTLQSNEAAHSNFESTSDVPSREFLQIKHVFRHATPYGVIITNHAGKREYTFSVLYYDYAACRCHNFERCP
jgi:hypothetical protein